MATPQQSSKNLVNVVGELCEHALNSSAQSLHEEEVHTRGTCDQIKSNQKILVPLFNYFLVVLSETQRNLPA
jgi:uncharacterized protein YbgA (DUF1722 family)